MTIFTTKSKDIFDAFVKSGRDVAKINVERDGRNIDTIYVTLLKFSHKHPEWNVDVRRLKGEIYLVRLDASTDPSDLLS